MAPEARWRVCRVSYYLCKAALYTFAAMVLWFVSDWAGVAFVSAVFLTKVLALSDRLRPVSVSTELGMVSRAAGPVA